MAILLHISTVVSRYDAFDHIGYDATGAKLMRRKTGDRIDMTIGGSFSHSPFLLYRTDTVQPISLCTFSKSNEFSVIFAVSIISTHHGSQ
jgi:hypothetical protein